MLSLWDLQLLSPSWHAFQALASACRYEGASATPQGMVADTLGMLEASWGQAKTFIEHAIGFSHDALHVIAGLVLQLIVAAVLRTSVRDMRPWLAVLVLELLNEWHDLRVETWPVPGMQWGEGAKDLLLTMALPTVLLLTARYYPRLYGPARTRRGHATDNVEE